MQQGDYAIQISRYPHVVTIDRHHESSPGYWVADFDKYTAADTYFIPASDLKKLERRTLKERKERVTQIPWVRRLPAPETCNAWIPKKHAFCSRTAEFRFKRHKNSEPYLLDGNYCWTHLIYRGLMADMTEENRTHAWERKQFFASLKDDRVGPEAPSQSL